MAAQRLAYTTPSIVRKAMINEAGRRRERRSRPGPASVRPATQSWRPNCPGSIFGAVSSSSPTVRCPWPGDDPLYVAYHDEEWGVPVRDDRDLFTKLLLDGAQAGLSWITILRKRDGYYRAFDDFDSRSMARWKSRHSKPESMKRPRWGSP